jgi:hypothetical protein
MKFEIKNIFLLYSNINEENIGNDQSCFFPPFPSSCGHYGAADSTGRGEGEV